jgi:hypothetical protein
VVDALSSCVSPTTVSYQGSYQPAKLPPLLITFLVTATDPGIKVNYTMVRLVLYSVHDNVNLISPPFYLLVFPLLSHPRGELSNGRRGRVLLLYFYTLVEICFLIHLLCLIPIYIQRVQGSFSDF